MRLDFTKMTGAGNDFVMLDNRGGTIKLGRTEVARLCDRHLGVGADGLILLEPATDPGARWRMRYYNADGGEAEMCGNGARCFVRFAHRVLDFSERELLFQTGAGLVRGRLDGDVVVEVGMTEPRDLSLDEVLALPDGPVSLHACNTGVPHAVVFVPDVGSTSVASVGAEIRHHARFAPKGANANFVQVFGPETIRVRTYERGVEAETMACGTGVTASAIVAHATGRVAGRPVRVRVQSGDTLEVGFDCRAGRYEGVTLRGPAVFVFEGAIEIA